MVVQLAEYLLLITHSNSYYESILSAIRKICSNGNHNLEKDATQLKINILGKKKLACYEWELLKSILAQTKSAT